MATFLAYVSGGSCRDTHAPTRNHDGEPIRAGMTRKQLWVIEELRRLGINAWCGTRVEFKRTGKSREWTRYDVPALPNYIVVEMDPQDMFTVTSVAHVSPTMTLVSGAAMHGTPARQGIKSKDGKGWDVPPRPARVGLIAFRADVEADFRAAERVDANSRAEVTEYKRGQSLRVVSGPFADMLVTFDKLVKAPHDKWQRIAGTTAGGMPVQFDPLDVRSA